MIRTIFILLIISSMTLWTNGKPNRTKITGVVVACDNGVVLTDGPCRQSMVVWVTRRNKGKPKEPYILVRREYPCNAGAFPVEMFQAKQTREFSLIRDSSCDQTFGRLRTSSG